CGPEPIGGTDLDILVESLNFREALAVTAAVENFCTAIYYSRRKSRIEARQLIRVSVGYLNRSAGARIEGARPIVLTATKVHAEAVVKGNIHRFGLCSRKEHASQLWIE